MPEIEIADLGSVGLIRDQEGHILPPEALTYARNVRCLPDGIERIGGQEATFGTPSVAPHFAMPIVTSASIFWLYVSLTKGYVYDGTSHTNITRQTAAADVDYTASNTRDWNGCLLGGVPILNNGSDDPQYWSALSAGTKLAKLANWPASTKAAVIRAFGPHLIALNVTEGSTNYPHMVRWSHPADPGTVPTSWDYTDETVDAGRTELPDAYAGIIMDGLPLRGNFYIYKENSIWRMRHVGGLFIFDFDTFLESSGILAPRCVTMTADGAQHVVATQDDIIVHNGNAYQSILPNRYKRYLFNTMDPVNYINSFIYTNPFRDEIVFCWPESGQTHPNRALIWSYKLGQIGVLTEADVNYRNAATGPVEVSAGELWSEGSNAWDVLDGPWSTLLRRRVVLCGTAATKFYVLDSGLTNDGTDFTGKFQREGLSLVGRKRNNEWIVDFEKRKMLRRVWVRATGGPINVRIGFQEVPGGATTWTPAQSFNPATQNFLDVFGSGRAVSIEFGADVPFKVLSYKLDGEVIGEGI